MGSLGESLRIMWLSCWFNLASPILQIDYSWKVSIMSAGQEFPNFPETRTPINGVYAPQSGYCSGGCWNSSATIVTWLRAGNPRNRDSYSKCNRGSGWVGRGEGNAAGARSWPLTSIQCRVYEWVELYLHSRTCVYGVHIDNLTS